ncbi:hypothetical protein ACHAXS_011951, partial [Conticribra weissflogii]
MGAKEHDEKGKTVGLMIRMTKPIHKSGKIVTMDSGFSVTRGIIAMKEKGVYGQALIKKRGRGWPKFIPGDEIDIYFSNKPIGHIATLNLQVDETQLRVHCQKDDGYVTKIMSCFGTPSEVEDHQTRRVVNGETFIFKYPEAISIHNKTKHAVDDV